MLDKKKGKLTIFFGYDNTLLSTMVFQGIKKNDEGYKVYIGCLDTKNNPSVLKYVYKLQSQINVCVDLNQIYEKKPDIVIIENLNLNINQQFKRCEEIRELLNEGYDVYTSLNISFFENDKKQNTILNDLFFSADYVFFADESKAINSLELRQKALYKYFQWLNRQDISLSKNEESRNEHILVCMSSSPSSQKIIRCAAKMATNYHCKLTALYVATMNKEDLKEQDQIQLQKNIDLAENLGAKVEIIYADDIVFQITEFARVSNVSKIVIGRNIKKSRFSFRKPEISEQLLSQFLDYKMYVIPIYERYNVQFKKEKLELNKKDILVSLSILFLCTILGYLFFGLGFNDSNIIMIYILGVFLIAIITTNRVYSIISSLISVLIFNFFFTFPTLSFSAYDPSYPMTFLIMFIVAFMTSNLATRIQQNAKSSSNVAQRTKILLDTNQILQKEVTKEGIVQKGCEQLHKLLNRNIIFYLVNDNELREPFILNNHNQKQFNDYSISNELGVVKWVVTHNKHAGASTRNLSAVKYLYLAVRVDSKVYGVVGIYLDKDRLDSFENNMLLAILGEMGFALKNEEIIREKNKTALKAKNEQLRVDLLRSISHDLRTPLTSISGNAGILLTNDEILTKEKKQSLYTDIYDDSLWLINLVENLLSVTRIENGTMKLNISPQIIEDVIYEALDHVNRKKIEHRIDVEIDDEFLMGDMDVRLIVQVIINIVDNAIKYTPKGSNIMIRSYKKEGMIYIEISDDGPGIPNDKKEKIFEKFYSANNQIVDSKRSLGLGLALCKSIINAHGGTISVSDHKPHGALFCFTLPETKIHLEASLLDNQ